MALKERWEADVKQAMLARNEVVRDTLRLLLSEIKKANLQDGKEKAELVVIQSYLPKAMSEAEAKAALQAIAKELGVSTKKDIGQVMKAAMAKHRGQLDGKLAQRLLAEILT